MEKNLIPVSGPQFQYLCKQCDSWYTHAARGTHRTHFAPCPAWADLNGKSFEALYCDNCINPNAQADMDQAVRDNLTKNQTEVA